VDLIALTVIVPFAVTIHLVLKAMYARKIFALEMVARFPSVLHHQLVKTKVSAIVLAKVRAAVTIVLKQIAPFAVTSHRARSVMCAPISNVIAVGVKQLLVHLQTAQIKAYVKIRV
jgi:hypothetical protein